MKGVDNNNKLAEDNSSYSEKGIAKNRTDTSGALEHRPPIRMTPSAKARNKSRLSVLSIGTLKDELVYQLSSVAKMNWETLEIINKYHERGKWVLYRINVYDLSAIDITNTGSKAVFVINSSDITPALYTELEELKNTDPKGFDELVTEAIQTILEGIDKRYYHIAGLPYKVTCRFEP